MSFTIDSPEHKDNPKKSTIKACCVDDQGVVTIKVSLAAGKKVITEPVLLTAVAQTSNGKFEAQAHIRVMEATQTREPRGKLNYDERPFEDGPSQHSRYLSRVIQVNTLNPDYIEQVVRGSDDQKLAYAVWMIFKEILAFNDKTGKSNDALERMLSFEFRRKKIKVK